MIIRKFSEIWLFLSWDAAFPKSCKFVKNNSVLLPTWLINQVAENKKVRLFWTQTKTISTSTNRNTVNFDEIISNIMSFLIAKNSLPLPSPDLTKKFSTSVSSNVFLRVLSHPFFKTQNTITTEPIKQLQYRFLYVIPYSIYFALIKRFPYCRFILQIKSILHQVMPCVPSTTTNGFSWYVVRVTRPEKANKQCYDWWKKSFLISR